MSRDELAARLIEARREAGLSHRDLAKKAGVSPGTISGLENAHHDVTTEKLARIALALSVEPCWLAYGDCDKAPDWLDAVRRGLVQ
ncbi:MAG: helix-turn-helix transcriptional regulator [Myxococcales bacterium]|nr:helix-turn-helix transcriptional regulator [Myxococcales bacterium]